MTAWTPQPSATPAPRSTARPAANPASHPGSSRSRTSRASAREYSALPRQVPRRFSRSRCAHERMVAGDRLHATATDAVSASAVMQPIVAAFADQRQHTTNDLAFSVWSPCETPPLPPHFPAVIFWSRDGLRGTMAVWLTVTGCGSSGGAVTWRATIRSAVTAARRGGRFRGGLNRFWPVPARISIVRRVCGGLPGSCRPHMRRTRRTRFWRRSCGRLCWRCRLRVTRLRLRSGRRSSRR